MAFKLLKMKVSFLLLGKGEGLSAGQKQNQQPGRTAFAHSPKGRQTKEGLWPLFWPGMENRMAGQYMVNGKGTLLAKRNEGKGDMQTGNRWGKGDTKMLWRMEEWKRTADFLL